MNQDKKEYIGCYLSRNRNQTWVCNKFDTREGATEFSTSDKGGTGISKVIALPCYLPEFLENHFLKEILAPKIDYYKHVLKEKYKP